MTCWVTSSAMWALAQMPGVATEPLLDAYDGAQSSQMRAKLLEALGRLKRDDERIVDRLVAALEVGEPARYLAHIGGQRAIDALADAFHRAVDVVLDEDSHQLARRRGIGDAELQRKLEDANFIYRMLEHTGYEPDSEMLHVAEQFKTLEMDLFGYRDWLGGTQKPHRAQEKPGRNDPCWCGSGKKYKKCHLRKD